MSEDPSTGPSRARARIHFIVAAALLFALAIVWSLGAFFVYVLLGAIVFFLFLGFRALPARRQQEGSRPYASEPQAQPAPTAKDYASFLRKKKERPVRDADPQARRNTKSVITIASVFIFSIFLVIALSVFIPRSDDAAEDAFAMGEFYFGSGQYDSACASYRRELKKNPANAKAILGLGKSFAELQRTDSALILYDRALAADGKLEEARFQKGWLLYQQKRYSESARELITLLDQNPQYFDAMQMLGNVYYDQEKYDEAFRWFDKAYASGLRGNWLCYVLGYLYQTRGDNARAIALYKEALTYDSTVTDIYVRLGQLLPGEDGNYYRQRGAGQQW